MSFFAPCSGRPGAGPPKLSTGDVFMLTALAKLGATLITYPMLLIKSRLQVGPGGWSERRGREEGADTGWGWIWAEAARYGAAGRVRWMWVVR